MGQQRGCKVPSTHTAIWREGGGGGRKGDADNLCVCWLECEPWEVSNGSIPTCCLLRMVKAALNLLCVIRKYARILQ